MSDLISRQAVLDGIAEWIVSGYADSEADCSHISSLVTHLPSVENKGKWKKTYLDHVAMGERPCILYCSVCCQCIAYPTNFCPNCGADMRGRQDGDK